MLRVLRQVLRNGQRPHGATLDDGEYAVALQLDDVLEGRLEKFHRLLSGAVEERVGKCQLLLLKMAVLADPDEFLTLL
jgi:hypothetical protein